MDKEIIVLDTKLRAFGQMIMEILEHEGIEAILRPGDPLTSALGSDGGNKDWKILVQAENAERAKEILEELQMAGELAELELNSFEPLPETDNEVECIEEVSLEELDPEII